MRRPTLADIARRAGVSKAAASSALNDRPGISEGKRAMVKAIAAEIGWQPSSAARALNGSRTQCVGLARTGKERTLGAEPFFMELVSGIGSELSPRGFAIILQLTEDHTQEVETYRRWWGEGRVDGVIMVDLHVADPRVAGVKALGIPAVVVGDPSESRGLTAVWSDDATPVHETVSYLHAVGHRTITRIAGRPELVRTRLRDRAFTMTCRELSVSEHTIIHTGRSAEEGARATRRALSSSRRPTAIVYDDGIMGVAGLSVAQEMGLAVPADLSIVAWDDSPFNRAVRPALATLTRDVPAHGAHAARALMSLIDGHTVPSFQDEAARLLPMASIAPPRHPD